MSPGPQLGGEVEGSGQGGGRGSPNPHPGGVSRPTPWGGSVCIPACTDADTPLPRGRLLPRAVRILLECILVLKRFSNLFAAFLENLRQQDCRKNSVELELIGALDSLISWQSKTQRFVLQWNILFDIVMNKSVTGGIWSVCLIQHEHNLQRAFNALCHSTHLYGRRLVLEWADSEESIDDLRRKTAQHYHEGKLHL